MKHHPSIQIPKAHIDTRTFSDHAAVRVIWSQEEQSGQRHWKLNTYLLLNKEVQARVRAEISLFFYTNKNTSDKMLLWDTFKAYIRGILINQKVYVTKHQREASRNILQNIAILEAQHKVSGEDNVKRKLDMETSKLKLLQTSKAAKSILYSK